MKSIIFFLGLLWLNGNIVLAQEIQVLTKKGKILHQGNVYGSGSAILLKPTDSLSVLRGSLVLARRGNACLELASNRVYTYKQLNGMMLKAKSYTPTVMAIFSSSKYVNHQKQQLTRGSRSEKLWSFSPSDSIRILSDSISLRIGTEVSKLLTDIKIFCKGCKDTVVLSKNVLEHRIALPKPGFYYWSYGLDNYGLKDEFLNCFLVPTSEEKVKLNTDYRKFLSLVNGFSSEMRSQLVSEYVFSQKLHIE